MITTLQDWDTALFLWLNSQHHPYVDKIMIFFTATFVWIPLYVLLGGIMIASYQGKAWRYLLLVGLIILCSDQFASGLVKPLIARPRPCHNPELQTRVFAPIGCGGLYGFISSHAANTFALATYVWLISAGWYSRRVLRMSMFIWAAVVSYSRIYLGVHYPADVFLGALSGVSIALGCWHVALRLRWIDAVTS
ncbi:MAG: phosphatase PAP2 family protein [Cytophagales bacterium]|nr:phosphatase PAP2 family protein [Bernardetiaceae bacterium]MDW8204897.1 phosphatase PAP2 family protein [Cytophagales bacterium]